MCHLKLSTNIQTDNKALLGGVRKSMFLFMEAEMLCEMEHKSLPLPNCLARCLEQRQVLTAEV